MSNVVPFCRAVPIEEIMKHLNQLHKEGKIRSILVQYVLGNEENQVAWMHHTDKTDAVALIAASECNKRDLVELIID